MRIYLKYKEQNLKHWHKWFAWYPIIVSYEVGRKEDYSRIYAKIIIWLENVHRKQSKTKYHWDYAI